MQWSLPYGFHNPSYKITLCFQSLAEFRCCYECAKQEGERCGGVFALHGVCDSNLRCDRDPTDEDNYGFNSGICNCEFLI